MSLLCDACPWILSGVRGKYFHPWVMCLSFTFDDQVPFKVTSDPKAAASHVSGSANTTTDKGKEKKPNIHRWMWNEQEHFCSRDSQLTQLCWVCGCCSFPFHTLGLQLRFVFQTQTVHFSTCCWSSFSSCCLVHSVTFYGAKIDFCGQEENCFIILTYTKSSTAHKSFFLVSLAISTLSNHDNKENKPDVHLWSCCHNHLKTNKQKKRIFPVELMYHYFLPPMSCSMICPEPCAHTGKKNFYVYLSLQLVYQFNWNWSAGLTSRGQHELKVFNMELHVTQEHVSMEKIWASLCHLMVLLPARCLLWLNCLFFSRYVYAAAHSATIELWSICSVSPMPSFPRGLCQYVFWRDFRFHTLVSILNHTSAVFGAPAPLAFHMHALSG